MKAPTAPPITMRAMVRRRYGAPDVLEWAEVPTPTPGAGQVLVRVHAAGLDRGAHHLMKGRPYAARLAFGLRRPRKPTFGLEVAGEVIAVGPDPSDLLPGDRVFGTAFGAFAEYVVAKPERLARMPEDWTFAQGTALTVSATTALQAVKDLAKVQRAERVLVLGASGGVGTFVVQIAVALGAEVTAVCSGAKATAVAALGASTVLDYRVDPLETAGRHDVIIDIAGNRSLRSLRSLLTPKGRLVIVGGEFERAWLGLGRQFRAVMLSPFVRQKLMMQVAKDRRIDLEALREMVQAGTIRPLIDRTMPLAELPQAMQAMEAGQITGKIVLTVES